MAQVFCSDPDMEQQQALILEQMEQEFQKIAPFCPDGEKAFERLLQLLDKLLSIRSAADACPEPEHGTDLDSDPGHEQHELMLRLQREVEEQKVQVRTLRQQLDEAEEENVKLLADKSDSEKQTASLQRHMHSIRNQLEDQSELKLNSRSCFSYLSSI